MMLIKSLCTGSCSLGKADVLTFCAMLRSSHAPPTIREMETGIARVYIYHSDPC